MLVDEYFKDGELDCPCCGAMPDEKSTEMLYALRLIYGKPITVTSGCRCEHHNEDVGGSENSTHLIGAFDIEVPPEDEYIIIQLAQAVGFTGIGIDNNKFIHLDRHHIKPTIWTY